MEQAVHLADRQIKSVQDIEDPANELRYAEAALESDGTNFKAMYRHAVHNLLKHTKRESSTGYLLVHILESEGVLAEAKGQPKVLKSQRKNAKEKKPDYPRDEIGKKQISPADWETLEKFFAQYATPPEKVENDPSFDNLLRLTEILGLSDVEREPLKFLYAAQSYYPMTSLVNNLSRDNLKKLTVIMARMIDNPLAGRKFYNALYYGGRLARYGILFYDNEMMSDPDDRMGVPVIDEALLDNLDRPLTGSEIASVLLGKPVTTDLEIPDFDHVGEPLEFLLTLIEKSVKNGEKGINILLHGPAGGGKTELAKTIAKHLKLRMFSIGELSGGDDESEYAPNGTKRGSSDIRMGKLQRTQALLDGSKDSIILFDEIEDLLLKGTDASKSADVENKLHVNRMLETNPVVTIWTGNDPDKFHDAVRQRFTYSILMDYPPTVVREKLWTRRLQIENVSLDKEDIRTLAREYGAPPRLIEKAIRSARIRGGGIDTIHRSLEAASQASFGYSDFIRLGDAIPRGFDLDLVGADRDLRGLFNDLVRRGTAKKPFSLLVRAERDADSGNVLRSIAESLVMNTLDVSVAELCEASPQKPPELKIASVFSAATEKRKFLILDGLEDATGVPANDLNERSWAFGHVNMITDCILNHRLPMAILVSAKTKLPDHISMIFSDQLSLGDMPAEKAAMLYERTFGSTLPQDRLKDMKGLVFEDFSKAKTFLPRLDIAGSCDDHNKLIGLLRGFMNRRRYDGYQKIGF